MTPEEIKKELARIAEEVKQEGVKAKKEFLEAIKEAAGKNDVEAIKMAFMEKAEAAEAQIAELRETAAKQGIKINELNEKGAGSKYQNPREALKAAIDAKKDDLYLLKTGGFNGKVNIELKTVGNLLTTNILPAVTDAIPYSLAQLESGITHIQRRQPFIRELLNAKPITFIPFSWTKKPNQAPEPTTTTVTSPAAQEPRRP